jgi:hypothetical protein
MGGYTILISSGSDYAAIVPCWEYQYCGGPYAGVGADDRFEGRHRQSRIWWTGEETRNSVSLAILG